MNSNSNGTNHTAQFLVKNVNNRSTAKLNFLVLLLVKVGDTKNEVLQLEILENYDDPIYTSALALQENMTVTTELKKYAVNVERLNEPGFKTIHYKALKPFVIV